MTIHVEKNTISARAGSLSPGDTFMSSGTFYIVTDTGELPELKNYDLVWSINLGNGYCRTFSKDTEVEQVELAVVLTEDLEKMP